MYNIILPMVNASFLYVKRPNFELIKNSYFSIKCLVSKSIPYFALRVQLKNLWFLNVNVLTINSLLNKNCFSTKT